ncbi:MAG: hypothetical protein OXG15_12540 [Gammaproteobacteria bacterium]|nr:hypothetical protein [Gammaproteobacteria bacterium]
MTTPKEELRQTPGGRRGIAVADFGDEISAGLMRCLLSQRYAENFSSEEEAAIQSVAEKARADLNKIANDIALGERSRFDWP